MKIRRCVGVQFVVKSSDFRWEVYLSQAAIELHFAIRNYYFQLMRKSAYLHRETNSKDVVSKISQKE